MARNRPKKPHLTPGFAGTLSAPERAEGEASPVPVRSPVADRGFTDAAGCRWTLARGPLDPRRAKRLAVSADLMSMGEAYDDEQERWFPAFLPEADRPGAWLEAGSRYDVDELLSYLAYEFTDQDGRTLLYIQTFC
ncbi:hypothetical protein [Kitasatospora sp. NPDC056181]|uniref:hypothetical protein n=1 Tax=Kitasatospora sp. NPDC056181 TaxID=3345737 RepID=UPI0035D6EF1B